MNPHDLPTSMHDAALAGPLAAARNQLSFGRRAGHLALLLAAGVMIAVPASLLATEPGLPPRTMVALAVLLAIGIAWSIYALWVLLARHTLLAHQQMAAGWIAMAAAAIFTAGAGALAFVTGASAALMATGLGLVQLGVAALVLGRAAERLKALRAERARLESRIAAH